MLAPGMDHSTLGLSATLTTYPRPVKDRVHLNSLVMERERPQKVMPLPGNLVI